MARTLGGALPELLPPTTLMAGRFGDDSWPVFPGAEEPERRVEEYRRLRERMGTQEQVAELLEVDRGTLNRREGGRSKVTAEHFLALSALLGRDG